MYIAVCVLLHFHIVTIRRGAAPVSTNGMVLAGGYTLDILTV